MGRKKKIQEKIETETNIETEKTADEVENEKKVEPENELSQIEEIEKQEKAEEKAKTEKKEKKTKKAKKEKISEEKRKLLERAAELGKALGEKDIKEELVEEVAKEKKSAIPSEDYLKYGVYLGTKVITPHMKQFVYKRRADGIAVIDVNSTDKYLKEAIKLLCEYNPEDFIIVCKREAGWKATKLFSELTGARCFTKKYPAGITTNAMLENFFDPKLIFICDPWVDKNALKDAKIMKKPVIALCDTNNYCFDITKFVPCNNKSNKSLGFILHLIAREYMKAKKIDKKLPEVDEFIGEEV